MERKTNSTPNVSQKNTLNVRQLYAKLEELERRIYLLEKENKELKKMIDTPNVGQKNTLKSERILGYRVFQNTTVSNGKTYIRWYAWINGKKVYIGKDKSKAEEKIKAYLAK